MSSPPLPACPRCGRRIAAWKMDHCVYCGEAFPPDFKQGVPEPDALKWVDRPGIPSDAAKQLELMKVVPLDREKRSLPVGKVMVILSLPIFAAIFYMLHSLVGRVVDHYLPGASVLVIVAGAVFLGYLAWSAFRGPRK